MLWPHWDPPGMRCVHVYFTHISGWTPLHYAAGWGHTSLVKLLLDRGADPNARTFLGNHTALDRVWMSRFVPDTDNSKQRTEYAKIVQLLKEKMIQWNARQKLERTKQSGGSGQPVEVARWGHREHVAKKTMLDDQGKDAASQQDLSNKLHDSLEVPPPGGQGQHLMERKPPEGVHWNIPPGWKPPVEPQCTEEGEVYRDLCANGIHINVPPHWDHGHLSADEAVRKHYKKHEIYFNGSFLQQWRAENNMTKPTKEQIEEVVNMSRAKAGLDFTYLHFYDSAVASGVCDNETHLSDVYTYESYTGVGWKKSFSVDEAEQEGLAIEAQRIREYTRQLYANKPLDDNLRLNGGGARDTNTDTDRKGCVRNRKGFASMRQQRANARAVLLFQALAASRPRQDATQSCTLKDATQSCTLKDATQSCTLKDATRSCTLNTANSAQNQRTSASGVKALRKVALETPNKQLDRTHVGGILRHLCGIKAFEGHAQGYGHGSEHLTQAQPVNSVSGNWLTWSWALSSVLTRRLRGGGSCANDDRLKAPAHTRVLGLRALHATISVPNRQRAIDFCTQVLGMRVLRHEELSSADEAGPENQVSSLRGKWSRTMVGYGDERTHFAIEIVYRSVSSQPL
jgi:catechol 2,3-dioxygenase-like lactoylglutathione lyase family enzyme